MSKCLITIKNFSKHKNVENIIRNNDKTEISITNNLNNYISDNKKILFNKDMKNESSINIVYNDEIIINEADKSNFPHITNLSRNNTRNKFYVNEKQASNKILPNCNLFNNPSSKIDLNNSSNLTTNRKTTKELKKTNSSKNLINSKLFYNNSISKNYENSANHTFNLNEDSIDNSKNNIDLNTIYRKNYGNFTDKIINNKKRFIFNKNFDTNQAKFLITQSTDVSKNNTMNVTSNLTNTANLSHLFFGEISYMSPYYPHNSNTNKFNNDNSVCRITDNYSKNSYEINDNNYSTCTNFPKIYNNKDLALKIFYKKPKMNIFDVYTKFLNSDGDHKNHALKNKKKQKHDKNQRVINILEGNKIYHD